MQQKVKIISIDEHYITVKKEEDACKSCKSNCGFKLFSSKSLVLKIKKDKNTYQVNDQITLFINDNYLFKYLIFSLLVPLTFILFTIVFLNFFSFNKTFEFVFIILSFLVGFFIMKRILKKNKLTNDNIIKIIH